MTKQPRLSMGPAALVAAAFIGPGTVVTASLAGANYGYALMWALVFSVLATMILQEMSARLGVVTQQGLGENIRAAIQQPGLRKVVVLLIFAAVIIGNSVYQGGNISGARMGLADLVPFDGQYIPVILGALAGFILWQGSYKLVEKVLIALVLLMSVAFLATFILTQPDWSALISGLLIPSVPTGSILMVVALIGTTVVPYNLFLHASSCAEKWRSADQLNEARQDIYISIPLGGLISLAIVATAASAFFGKALTIEGAADLGQALQPLFGDAATTFMALGLFAAGLSSSLTAPLASAYALSGVLGYANNLKDKKFRAIWGTILTIGILVASLGLKPIEVILFAQVANGLLLPFIAIFLVWVCNQPRLGLHRNSRAQNILGIIVCFIATGLGMRSIAAAFGWL
ncbi:NRAMP (natural resistance-associated macrophage protein) metal ion transporters [Pseudidiomarina maritima]|uniref:NRAMP (Natural resistance-associated macrophage protein) metal ion transporters n=1 Tax=Pseudidiomarina maritima TaxID=519453 RepID=A0A1I6H4R0_9GAMM|nr:Nramp family divalent metal transporter [Pseudidiomarina maritima]SFR49465.1 NRAMP (natural resistance-associated macrophage protein) metal ion transporters [Pseudidiomarina maritima]